MWVDLLLLSLLLLLLLWLFMIISIVRITTWIRCQCYDYGYCYLLLLIIIIIMSTFMFWSSVPKLFRHCSEGESYLIPHSIFLIYFILFYFILFHFFYFISIHLSAKGVSSGRLSTASHGRTYSTSRSHFLYSKHEK